MKAVAASLCTLTIAGIFACGGEGARVLPAGTIKAVLDTSDGKNAAKLVVGGLSSDELKFARNLSGDSAWHAFAAVTVGGNPTPVLGTYHVNDSALVFTPKFSFDAGRAYSVRVHPKQLSAARGDSAFILIVSLPSAPRGAPTSVLRILPTGDVLPENLLRLYIEFDAPMSNTGGLEYLKLLDDKGQEVKQAFLPIESDFWNGEHTRYTVFLDPGRVKTGILPNEQLGRPLVAGRTYSIVVDSTWRDAHDQLLKSKYTKTFRVAGADESRIDYKKWTVSSPKSGTRDTLVVKFEKSLDHGLVKRALGVESESGKAVPGETDLGTNEREWRFVPNEPWSAGKHNLIILAFLEDAAGNRVDGAFEVDMFNQIDKSGAPARYRLTFTVFSH